MFGSTCCQCTHWLNKLGEHQCACNWESVWMNELKIIYKLFIQINLFINFHEMFWHAMSYANYLSTAFCEICVWNSFALCQFAMCSFVFSSAVSIACAFAFASQSHFVCMCQSPKQFFFSPPRLLLHSSFNMQTWMCGALVGRREVVHWKCWKCLFLDLSVDLLWSALFGFASCVLTRNWTSTQTHFCENIEMPMLFDAAWMWFTMGVMSINVILFTNQNHWHDSQLMRLQPVMCMFRLYSLWVCGCVCALTHQAFFSFLRDHLAFILTMVQTWMRGALVVCGAMAQAWLVCADEILSLYVRCPIVSRNWSQRRERKRVRHVVPCLCVCDMSFHKTYVCGFDMRFHKCKWMDKWQVDMRFHIHITAKCDMDVQLTAHFTNGCCQFLVLCWLFCQNPLWYMHHEHWNHWKHKLHSLSC